MGHSHFVAFVLISTLLFLSIPQGYGRRLLENPADALPSLMQETPRKTRRLGVDLMDYGDQNVGPNVNGKSGFPFNIPSTFLSPSEPPSSD
ncbi:hypothetical protein BVRB_2g046870 [Beta vulgaris subsp. vulgaris]|nr:hypothetical protein BVRB_2g046870 [Beta vulgaris subsp. vulgaris]